MQKYKLILKHIRYLLELIGVIVFYTTCRILPFKASSALFGGLAKYLGPWAKVSLTARRNLKRVFLGISDPECDRIIRQMWSNIGRTFGEYPHLNSLNVWSTHSPVTFVNSDIIEWVKMHNTPVIFVLCHLANWEYATLGAVQKGIRISQLYRTLNNPYVDRFVTHIHSHIAAQRVTKGAHGARQLMAALKQNLSISMLVDQKFNEGLAVPFCGIDAMTAPAYARMALRFNCPIIPVRVQRGDGTECRVTYHNPIHVPSEGTTEKKTVHILTQVNDLFSKWIQQNPEDWLWIHNRWPPMTSKKALHNHDI